MSDKPNGANGPMRPAGDPLAIPTELYLLDALLQHAQAVINQFAFRGRLDNAQQLATLIRQVSGFRAWLEANPPGASVVLAGPGDIPKG